MDEHRDELDAWLSERVEPLLPQPGTFERIRREARRRRRRRVMAVLSTAAVIVLAAAAGLPRLLAIASPGPPSALTHRSSPHATASGGQKPSPTPGGGLIGSVTSVTFVGAHTGWVLGGNCGTGATRCITLHRTNDSGHTWYRVNPPPTRLSSGARGVSQVRFFNRSAGWLFGPELWSTHDSGGTWQQVDTRGRRVLSLETRRSRVYALEARCTGTGTDFAAHCTRFSVYSSTPYGSNWRLESGNMPGMSAPRPSAAGLLLTGTNVYLITPAGVLFTEPIGGRGGWQQLSQLPCTAPLGPPRDDGQPATCLLASAGPAGAPALAVLSISPPSAGSGIRPRTLYVSADGGTTWPVADSVPARGTATSLSGFASRSLALATTSGIYVSRDLGRTWRPARLAPPRGGFSYLGMTEPWQGVALPADPGVDAVWMTYDGGAHWREIPLR